MIDIFTAYGTIKEISPEEASALSPEMQDALAALLGPVRDAEKQDQLCIELRDHVRDLMVVHDVAVAEDQLRNKPADAVSAARDWISAQSGQPVVKKKLHMKSRQALIDAVEKLAEARADWSRALYRQSKITNPARAEAIGAWIALCAKSQPTQSDLVKEHAAAFVPNPAGVTDAAGKMHAPPVMRHPIDNVDARDNKSRMRTPASNKSFPGGGLPTVKHRLY
jgi:hypothetical protein